LSNTRSSLEETYASYEDMPDEEVAELAREGDGDALEYLLNKYKNFVRAKARSYFLIGADREDIVQEGMIGLYKAVRDFRSARLTSFRAFAELCITRQIITAVKTATRQKHAALNAYISIDLPVCDQEEERTFGETLTHAVCDGPETATAGRELERELRGRIRQDLSELEAQVLLEYLEGNSYGEIAASLDLQVKQVDNALQRAKKKLAKCYSGLEMHRASEEPPTPA